MRRTILLGWAVVATWVGPVGVQSPAQTALSWAAGPDIDAVIACVRYVRETGARTEFDAYVNINGVIRPKGTAEDISLFNRCLREPALRTEAAPSPGDVSPAPKPPGQHQDTPAKDRGSDVPRRAK